MAESHALVTSLGWPADPVACVIYPEPVFPRPRSVQPRLTNNSCHASKTPKRLFFRPLIRLTNLVYAASPEPKLTRTHSLTHNVQVISRRVPTSSRLDVLSATPLRRTAATRSALPCTASGAARLVPSRATPTPMPTSRRALSGTTTLSSSTSRTPRSTSPVPRWPSVA